MKQLERLASKAEKEQKVQEGKVKKVTHAISSVIYAQTHARLTVVVSGSVESTVTAEHDGGTAAASPPPTGIGDHVLCGSQPLVIPVSLCRFRD